MTNLFVFAQPPQNSQKLQFPPLFFLLLIFLALTTTTTATDTDGGVDVPYSQHCNGVVPEYSPSSTPISSFRPLVLRQAHVISDEDSRINPSKRYTKTLTFRTDKAYSTTNDDVFKLSGVLTLNGIQTLEGHSRNFTRRRGLRLVHFRPPRIPLSGESYRKKVFLSGFWNSASGKLCMVGSGLGRFGSVSHVILKLNYLNSSNIYTSIVNGTLESSDIDDKSAYFDPISIIGLNMRFYDYELIENVTKQPGFNHLDDLGNVSVGSALSRIIDVISSARGVELEYNSDCGGGKCNVFGGVAGNFMPSRLHFRTIDNFWKVEENVRFLLAFGEIEYNRWFMPFDPKVSLVSEGKWDKEKKRLNMVGCRILSGEESLNKGFIGDCSVRLSLRMLLRWTLRERNAVVGEMWSSKGVNESGYFGRVELRTASNSRLRVEDLRYEYKEMENVRKYCNRQMIHKGKEAEYPLALSSDMRFDMVVTDKKGGKGWGYSSPLTVGDTFYQQMRFGYVPYKPHNDSNMVNVSYVLRFRRSDLAKLTEISAEGLYDSKSGHLCMIGCKHERSFNGKLGDNNDPLDCGILINIQYASLNAKNGDSTKGTIESTRNKSDPLYFEPLGISSHSVYEGQAKESIWRMDFEITMVLISNTLTCLFVGLQLLHVKRNPGVLPSVSLVMLIVLVLAHMIPLLLNFEALFLANRNRQNLYFGSDGWLEVNEVLVRVITMIDFLLELRLLQRTWSARGEDSNQKSLWISDKKVLYLSLPLYIGGGLISWLVYLFGKSYQSPYPTFHYRRHQKESLWRGLKSYAGLILDGFLLPQVLFNIFCDAKEKVLTPSFYVGTTLVRLLPHAYDLLRVHSSTWSFSYIYANPRMDYYSTAWDIIISVVGLMLVLIIFLQQRFGGRCFLPNKFRQSSVYEKVATVGNEQS